MRVRRLDIDGFKNISAEIHFASAVVLFGKNDSGKTNLLEAVDEICTESRAFRSETLPPPLLQCDVEFLIELEGLKIPGHADRDLLAGLVQVRHLPPLFRWRGPEADEALGPYQADAMDFEERWSRGVAASRYPAAELVWAGLGEDLPGDGPPRSFYLGCVGPLMMGEGGAPENDLGSLEDALSHLRKFAAEFAAAHVECWQDVESDYGLLLEACFASRWLLHSGEATQWLAPPVDECGWDLRDAASRLASRAEGTTLPIIDGFVRQLLDESAEPAAFLKMCDGRWFVPWEIVRASATPESLARLTTAVEDYVRNEIESLHWLDGDSPLERDVWIDQGEGGNFAVGAAVRLFCDALGRRATEFAPPFIRRDYGIEVQALSPADWRRYGNRRVRIVLRRHEGGDRFDVSVVGSGIALWTALSVDSAMRAVEETLAELYEEELAGPEPSEREPDEAAPHEPPTAGQQTTLYLLDEPERHLHPAAQHDAAKWIAELAGEDAVALLATHALPFLSLPTKDVEYGLVYRDLDGETRIRLITGDAWRALEDAADASGLASRAQLLQLMRGLLIVEGAHDEAVIRHFYSQELGQRRILVLPTRGAKKVGALLEAEFVALLDIPLVILFDDIRAEKLESDSPPSGGDVAARAVWDLLRNWPSTRGRPPEVVEFALPDILCALPNECVERVVKQLGGSFPGWPVIVDEFRSSDGSQAFKKFLFKRTDLATATDPTAFLSDVLEICRFRPSDELEAAMNEVFVLVNRAV